MFDHEVIIVDHTKEWVESIGLPILSEGDTRKVEGKVRGKKFQTYQSH